MKLIPNWKRSWRMLSVQALAVVAFLQVTVAALPPETMDAVLPWTEGMTWRGFAAWLSFVAAVFGGFGRLVDQPSTHLPGEAEDTQPDRQHG